MRDAEKIDRQHRRLESLRRRREKDKAAREIVRRLAEATTKEVNPEAAYKRIAYDAAKLWAEMQEDVKGGGGEAKM